MKKVVFILITLLIVVSIGCSGGDSGSVSDTGKDILIADVSITDTGKDASTDLGEARWVKPEGYAVVTFYVDDSENQTYKDGQMKWNGSFVWDEKSNIAVFASSWLPTDGPFPVLYDDGPISKGGHEMEGAISGDHIFSTEIYIKPDPENDIVFDPFAGVGTTAVVAKKLNRKFVIIEMDEEFCLYAQKRLTLAETDKTIQGYFDGVFWERNTLNDLKLILNEKNKI